MQAIQFLKMAHGEAQAAFQAIEAAPEAGRGILWDKLRPELEAHEKMEQDHLYEPVAREVESDRALAYWEKAHHREVEAAESLIDKIDRLDPSDPMWLATVTGTPAIALPDEDLASLQALGERFGTDRLVVMDERGRYPGALLAPASADCLSDGPIQLGDPERPAWLFRLAETCRR